MQHIGQLPPKADHRAIIKCLRWSLPIDKTIDLVTNLNQTCPKYLYLGLLGVIR